MPLSKKRMRERKQLDRLGVKPKSNLNLDIDVKPKQTIPLYNPCIHKAGDEVLVKRGNRLIPTIIPELDADGQVIPRF